MAQTSTVEARSPRALNCLFCGKGYFTFNSLAYHVKNACAKVSRQDRGAAGLLFTPPREIAPMAKAAKAYNDSTPQKSAGGFSNGNPILKIDQIKGQTKAVLTGAIKPYDGDFGSGFFVAVMIAGKTYDFRCKSTSGNFTRIKELAPREKDLKGKAITLEVRSFEKDGELIRFIAIV